MYQALLGLVAQSSGEMSPSEPDRSASDVTGTFQVMWAQRQALVPPPFPRGPSWPQVIHVCLGAGQAPGLGSGHL